MLKRKSIMDYVTHIQCGWKVTVIVMRSRIDFRKDAGITNCRWKQSLALRKKLIAQHHYCRGCKGFEFEKMTDKEIEEFKNEPRLRYKTFYKKPKHDKSLKKER